MSNPVPEGWSVKTIDDVSTVFAGGTPSRSNPSYYGGGIPWVKSGEVNSRLISCTEETISELAVKESSARWAKAGSVLVAMYGATAGKVAKLQIDATLNQAVSAINGKAGLANNDFLLFALEHNTRELLNSVQGSGQPNLSGQLIKTLNIHLPPLPEQQKIAAILSTVDDVIEKTRAQIDKLKDLKTGMMQELLTKGIGSGGVPHTEFKDSPVGRIPVGWACVRLSECSDLITKGATPTTYGYDYKDCLGDGGARFIRGNNATLHGEYLEREVKYICEGANDMLKRSQLKVGDIVISIVGSVGASFQVSNRVIPANINQNVALIRPGANLDTDYLRQVTISHIIQDAINLELTVQAQPSISLKQVGNFYIPLPSLNEQKEISEALQSTDTLILSAQKKFSTHSMLKKALMQDLLTGKVRVKVDNNNLEDRVAV